MSSRFTQVLLYIMLSSLSILFLQESKAKFEVTADFNRLSLMFMRLDDVLGVKTARKVSTATMSCARVQASIGKIGLIN